MSTLITGAGLVGTAFARVAAKRHERLVFLDAQPREEFLRLKLGDTPHELVTADVRDPEALATVLRDREIDTVVHTAGLIGRRVADALADGFAINVGGTANLAEAVVRAGVRRLVHVSSTGVYDWRRPTDVPVDESFPRGGGGPYGNFNVAKELVLEGYARHHGFELMVIRTASVIGVGHGWAGSGGARKLRALAEAGLAGTAARIPARQTMAYEYVGANDLGRAIDTAATIPVPDANVFNIANGRVTSFDELVAAARHVFPDLQVDVLPGERPVDRRVPVDVSRARRLLRWRPESSLEEAFAEFARELEAIGLDRLVQLEH